MLNDHPDNTAPISSLLNIDINAMTWIFISPFLVDYDSSLLFSILGHKHPCSLETWKGRSSICLFEWVSNSFIYFIIVDFIFSIPARVILSTSVTNSRIIQGSFQTIMQVLTHLAPVVGCYFHIYICDWFVSFCIRDPFVLQVIWVWLPSPLGFLAASLHYFKGLTTTIGSYFDHYNPHSHWSLPQVGQG